MVKSYRGNEVDMVALAKKYEKNLALGNMNSNGRGDKIGKGGVILKSREEILKDAKESLVTKVSSVSFTKNTDVSEEMEMDTIKVAEPTKKTSQQTYKDITEEEKEDLQKGK